MSAQDRRDSYRLQIEPGRAMVRVAGQRPVALRDLSASGGRLVLDEAPPSTDGELPAVVELAGGESFGAQLQIVRVRRRNSGTVELGARFVDLSEDAIGKLSSFIEDEHCRSCADPERLLDETSALLVTNRIFIANLFSSPSEQLRVMYVVDGRERLPVHLVVEGQCFEDGRRLIKARFAGDAARLVPGHVYTFALSGPGAITVFESTCVRQRGLDVFITTPAQVRQTGFRESPRVVLKPAEVKVTVRHPHILGTRLVAPVQDVAGRGISFSVASDHGLFPGGRLDEIRIELPEGGTVQALGIIRSIAPRGEGERLSCGVELTEFAGPEDEQRWQRFVFLKTHPDLVDGRGRAEEAWEVLESSRYIDLWTPGPQRAYIHRQFLRSWRDAPSGVGQGLLLKKEVGAVGVSAASLAYPGTWMLHHLGVANQESGRDIMIHASELICGILTRLRQIPDLEHFVIYAEQGKRWNERLYADFARRYQARDKLLLQTSRVYRRLTEGPLPTLRRPKGALQIAEATPALWAALAGHARAALPGAERAACALDAEQIALKAFTDECAAQGYERRRQAYFAMLDGRPLAAIVLETGGEGVNVFGLLNTCRIYWMSPAPAEVAPVIRERLLAMAIWFFRSAPKRSFLLFDEDEQEDPEAVALGFEPIAPALRWLAHRDVIPAWAAYLRDLLSSPRPSLASSDPLDVQPVRAASQS
jgi:hypothetical protein